MNDGVHTNSRAFDANRPLLGNNEGHNDGFFHSKDLIIPVNSLCSSPPSRAQGGELINAC